MDRFVTIPRDALAALLKASGSSLTPEAFLASLQTPTDEFSKFSSRSAAAMWSKYFLLAAAVLSGLWTCMPFGFGFESILITVILGVLTYFEFRIHSGFRGLNPAAPSWGFRNQSAFAAFILIYCLYHAFAPLQVPASYREYMDPEMARMVRMFTLGIYLTIGIVGGVSQFCLAWFYRSARF